MNISHLRCFVLIYEKRNISQAAEACFLPQQALSRLIKNLEASYGVPLFVRTARGVTPTAYGEVLYAHAKKIVEEADHAQAAIEELQRKCNQRISVGMLIGTFNPYSALPPHLFDLFMKQHPDYSVEIQELSCKDCLQGILDGKLDVAYMVNCPENASLSRVDLMEEPSCVAFSSGHKLAKRRPLKLSDFRDVTILYHRNNPLPSSELERAFRLAGFLPPSLPISESIGEMVEWARLGRGVLLAGETSFRAMNLQGLMLEPFPDHSFVHTHSLIYSNVQKLRPNVKELIRFLLDNKKELTGK